MTGHDLATLNTLYRDICSMMKQKPDLGWLLGGFASDDRYRDIDLLREMRRFHEWHSDQKTKPKSHKLALRNWMRKAAPGPAPAARSLAAPPPVPVLRHHVKEASLAWAKWKHEAAKLMDPHTFDTWLSPSEGIGMALDNVTVVVAVPNDTVRDYLPTICKQAAHPLPFDVQFITAQARTHARRSPAQD